MLRSLVLSAGLACATLGGSLCDAQDSQVGRRFPPERRTFKDERTGLTITQLTTHAGRDDKIYQTHPSWTPDGKHIIFRSMGRAEETQAYAYSEESGEIIQLTDGLGNDTGSLNIDRKTNKLYFTRGGRGGPRVMVELDLDRLLADSERRAMKPAAEYERVIVIPGPVLTLSGGFGVDAEGGFAVLGVQAGVGGVGRRARVNLETAAPGAQPVIGGIRKLDLKTGEMTTVIDVPYQMGHVQCSPFVSGDIMYCHETGGDAPQRMWFIRADGTGNKKLYEENPADWISHEVFVSPDVVMFNMIAHLPQLNRKPAGIGMVNIRDDSMRLLGQVPVGRGYWHVAGTPDLKWAVGDNFIGELYRINVSSGEQKLLTAGHAPNAPDIPLIHSHHSISHDGKRVLFNSSLLGNSDLMIVELPQEK